MKVIGSVSPAHVQAGAPIARRITEYFATPAGARRAAPFPELSDREREILDLAARGLNDKRIVSRLCLSERAREAGLGRER